VKVFTSRSIDERYNALIEVNWHEHNVLMLVDTVDGALYQAPFTHKYPEERCYWAPFQQIRQARSSFYVKYSDYKVINAIQSDLNSRWYTLSKGAELKEYVS
jgi:hypothetical protein